MEETVVDFERLVFGGDFVVEFLGSSHGRQLVLVAKRNVNGQLGVEALIMFHQQCLALFQQRRHYHNLHINT